MVQGQKSIEKRVESCDRIASSLALCPYLKPLIYMYVRRSSGPLHVL